MSAGEWSVEPPKAGTPAREAWDRAEADLASKIVQGMPPGLDDLAAEDRFTVEQAIADLRALDGLTRGQRARQKVRWMVQAMSGHETELYADPDDWTWADRPDPSGHDFLFVIGHPDDDECTFRADGTDRTYCGQTRAAHGYTQAQLDAAWEDGAVL